MQMPESSLNISTIIRHLCKYRMVTRINNPPLWFLLKVICGLDTSFFKIHLANYLEHLLKPWNNDLLHGVGVGVTSPIIKASVITSLAAWRAALGDSPDSKTVFKA